MSNVCYELAPGNTWKDKNGARGVNQCSDNLSLLMAISFIVIFKLLVGISLSVPPVSAVSCYPTAGHANVPQSAGCGKNRLHTPYMTGGTRTSEKQQECYIF